MRYHGGKSRLAKKFAPILIEALSHHDGRLVESCVGGFNIVPALGDAVKSAICNDIHPGLICLYKAIQNRQFKPPKSLTRERYNELKDKRDYTNPLTAFVAFGCSFGGKEWGGYAQGGFKSDGSPRNHCDESGRLLISKNPIH